MRRLAGHMFTLCSAVSLLLFVAACVLWARSGSIIDSVQWRRTDGDLDETWRLVSAAGRVGLSREQRFARNLPAETDLSWVSGTALRLPPRWMSEGNIPAWHLVVYTGVLPLWFLVRRHYSTFTRRRRDGLCLRCGYDLRASPDRCPECGTLAGRKVST